MTRKEKLENLIREGFNLIGSSDIQDNHTYLVWKEKVETTIEREYGKESTEFQKISHSDLKPPILTGNPGDAVERRKKNIGRILAKLEAWVALED